MTAHSNPARRPTLLVATLIAAAVLAGAAASDRGRPAPQEWILNVDKAMTAIGVVAGMRIGEAGAGDGYFTFPLAARVGARGRVYAEDIDSSALARLKDRRRHEGVENILTVPGDPDDPLFPRPDLDMIVIAHAFHDFGNPAAWLRSAKKYLGPKGTVAIVDQDPATTGDRHYLSRERILQLFTEAGYRSVTNTVVDRNHLVMVFRPAPARTGRS